MSISRQVIIAIIITCGLSTYFTYEFCKRNGDGASNNSSLTDTTKWPVGKASCDINIKRMQGYKYVQPLLYVEKGDESANLIQLKSTISSVIDKYKKENVLISASVYLRVYKNANWMCLNDTETYLPGSLIKVAGLLTYLRMEEEHPGVLNRTYALDSKKDFIPYQTFNSKQIEFGKSYTVKELLKYMIAYSDNNATYLLNKNVDNAAFMKLFSELGIAPPDLKKGEIKMTVKDYSIMMRVLYNATYLNPEHSEFAAGLLAQCDFDKGMVSGLPKDMKIAHKFGEMGDATTRQLHESGIIYADGIPFILTVMTKGYDITKLPAVISEITKLTYDDITKDPEFSPTVITDKSGGGLNAHALNSPK